MTGPAEPSMNRELRNLALLSGFSVVESARKCFAVALTQPIRDDSPARELYASDQAFRDPNACAREYARRLLAAGEPADSIVGIILAAVDHAAEPGEAHPALRAAVDAWAREAIDR